MRLDNDRWYESLGEAVNRIAQTYIDPVEKGRLIENIYVVMQIEAERDSRESFNRQQGEKVD
jgi:hypothetical protein